MWSSLESYITETSHSTQLLLLVHSHLINNIRARSGLSSNSPLSRNKSNPIRKPNEIPSLLKVQVHNIDKTKQPELCSNKPTNTFQRSGILTNLYNWPENSHWTTVQLGVWRVVSTHCYDTHLCVVSCLVTSSDAGKKVWNCMWLNHLAFSL